ncbi:cytochrome P450 [Natronococcus occultus]|uniref:Cytochrome P450 n=1 Tax=Natronococcus occultus SP4 TaxID=694430 RepID=L0JZ04_9EURY|nr:cytochrome P450 [Natronococcus occultus]AGB37103.1 cytochrome P450 [Natronococcus occultus SP4]
MTPQSELPPSPSGHPILGHALDFARDPFALIDRATDECGDCYRMTFPSAEICVLAHPEHFRQALVTDVDSFGKTADYQRAFGNGLLSTEGDQWRRQRNVLQPLFHGDRIDGYADKMVEATQRRIGTWEAGEVRDLESEMQDLTFEILFATLFGRDLAPGEGADLRAASDGLNKWFVSTSWLLPNWIPTPARRTFNQSSERLREETQRLLAKYEAEAEQSTASDLENETVLSKLQDAQKQGHLSKEEVEGQMVTMLFAGYETTAATLGFAWYALAKNPALRDAFHDELEAVLGGEPPSQETIGELDLTRRIVTETLRLYPPVHTIPRQTTREIEIDGYCLPANEEVHLSVIAAHRDERFYDDPLSFRPERWQQQSIEERHDFAYIPFGGGRRTCIGREFARLEAMVVLATIGQQWSPEWTKGDSTVTLDPAITIQAKDGLPMRLQQRS